MSDTNKGNALVHTFMANKAEYEVDFDGNHLKWSKRGKQTTDSTKCLQLQDLLHVEISNNENNKNATLCVHYIDKLPDNKWKHGQICLQAQMENDMVERWKQTLECVLVQVREQRPKKLLVFLNPNAGGSKSQSMYDEVAAPLFKVANIHTDVIVTEHGNHAAEVLHKYDLTTVDGLVSVGGDGTFNLVFNAYYRRFARDNSINVNDPETVLQTAPLPIGILPTGSMQFLVQAVTYGERDMMTATLHIITGQTRMFSCMSIHNNGELSGIGAIATGLLLSSDVIKCVEANRTWVKTKYLLATIKALWYFRSADVTVSYKTDTKEWKSTEANLKTLAIFLFGHSAAKKTIKWLPDGLRLITANSNLTRMAIMTHMGAFYGDEDVIKIVDNMECVDTPEVKITFPEDKFSSESVSIDGELADLKAPEVHLKFHPKVISVFGDGRTEHPIQM